MATIDEIITDTRAYADSWTNQAQLFLNQLQAIATTNISVADSTLYTAFAGDRSQDALSAIQGAKPTSPARPDISVASPDVPDVDDVLQVELPSIPQFETPAPELSFPVRPSTALPGAPAQPEITDPELAEEPANIQTELDRLLTDLANLNVSFTMPESPNTDLPEFTATAPTERLVAPSNTFAFYEQAYESANLDAIQAKILNDLENGGYGIETNDETDLWDRMRDREAEASNTRIAEVEREFANRNFPIPSGAFFTALEAANQQGQGEVSDANRDITLRRSELYVQNRQFILGQGTQLENILIGFHSSMMERTLNAERITLQAAIDIFNASVAQYNAQLQGYQTETSVFEARLRSAATAVQIFKTQVEASQLELENSEIAARVYQTSAGVLQQSVSLHNTRLESTRIQTDIQRQRLDAFRAAVSGYEATVRAKIGEFDMYTAGIRGESAKIEAYGEEVGAYRVRVQAVESESNVKIANLRADIDRKQLDLQHYDSQIKKYNGDLNAQVQEVTKLIDWYRSDTSLWSAEANAITRSFDIALNTDNINVTNANQLNRHDIEQSSLQLKALLDTTQLRTMGAAGGLDVYGNIIQGAMGVQNTLAAEIGTTEN